MIRINLLPPYIHEGSRRKQVIALLLILIVGVAVAGIYYKSTIDAETKRIKDENLATEPQAKEADDTAAKASRINSDSAVVRGRADFVRNSKSYNEKTYQEVLKNVASYTWPRVLYDGIQMQGQSVMMPAYAPSLADIGHYMIYMSRNPNISRVDVQLASIPGFPDEGGGATAGGGQQQGGRGVRPLNGAGHDFTVQLSLVKAIADPPTYSGGGGGNGGQGGGGGAPGGGGPVMGPGGGGGGGMNMGGKMSGSGGGV